MCLGYQIACVSRPHTFSIVCIWRSPFQKTVWLRLSMSMEKERIQCLYSCTYLLCKYIQQYTKKKDMYLVVCVQLPKCRQWTLVYIWETVLHKSMQKFIWEIFSEMKDLHETKMRYLSRLVSYHTSKLADSVLEALSQDSHKIKDWSILTEKWLVPLSLVSTRT